MKDLNAKKKIIAVLIAICATLTLSACNKQVFDTTYKFDRAIISLPNGEVIEGKVDSWKDYDGEQIQVKIDGITYVVNSTDVVLIAE
jgi:ribosomal protein S1